MEVADGQFPVSVPRFLYLCPFLPLKPTPGGGVLISEGSLRRSLQGLLGVCVSRWDNVFLW